MGHNTQLLNDTQVTFCGCWLSLDQFYAHTKTGSSFNSQTQTVGVNLKQSTC